MVLLHKKVFHPLEEYNIFPKSELLFKKNPACHENWNSTL